MISYVLLFLYNLLVVVEASRDSPLNVSAKEDKFFDERNSLESDSNYSTPLKENLSFLSNQNDVSIKRELQSFDLNSSQSKFNDGIKSLNGTFNAGELKATSSDLNDMLNLHQSNDLVKPEEVLKEVAQKLEEKITEEIAQTEDVINTTIEFVADDVEMASPDRSMEEIPLGNNLTQNLTDIGAPIDNLNATNVVAEKSENLESVNLNEVENANCTFDQEMAIQEEVPSATFEEKMDIDIPIVNKILNITQNLATPEKSLNQTFEAVPLEKANTEEEKELANQLNATQPLDNPVQESIEIATVDENVIAESNPLNVTQEKPAEKVELEQLPTEIPEEERVVVDQSPLNVTLPVQIAAVQESIKVNPEVKIIVEEVQNENECFDQKPQLNMTQTFELPAESDQNNCTFEANNDKTQLNATKDFEDFSEASNGLRHNPFETSNEAQVSIDFKMGEMNDKMLKNEKNTSLAESKHKLSGSITCSSPTTNKNCDSFHTKMSRLI